MYFPWFQGKLPLEMHPLALRLLRCIPCFQGGFPDFWIPVLTLTMKGTFLARYGSKNGAVLSQKRTKDTVYNVGKEQLSRKMTRKLSTVEVVLVLEITPCPLTNLNRDSKDNLQDKGWTIYYNINFLLPTFDLLFPLYRQLQLQVTYPLLKFIFTRSNFHILIFKSN